jgi:hypothetical protein
LDLLDLLLMLRRLLLEGLRSLYRQQLLTQLHKPWIRLVLRVLLHHGPFLH